MEKYKCRAVIGKEKIEVEGKSRGICNALLRRRIKEKFKADEIDLDNESGVLVLKMHGFRIEND
jgi:hypothetical protein